MDEPELATIDLFIYGSIRDDPYLHEEQFRTDRAIQYK